MLRELSNAAHAYHQRSGRIVNIRPSSGGLSILDALPIAAELKGGSAESSNMGLRHLREAQMLCLGEGNAPIGGPTKKMKKLLAKARATGKLRLPNEPSHAVLWFPDPIGHQVHTAEKFENGSTQIEIS